MYTETFYQEEQEKGYSPKVYAVSPGVIDTGMQEQIRDAAPGSFSSHDNFVRLKDDNELFSPEEAASRLVKLLGKEYTGNIDCDLREV